MDGNSRNNAINLFIFLKEYARLSHKPVRSLDSNMYREVFWFGQVPRESECSCVLWKEDVGEDGKPFGVTVEGWLEISRPERSDPPEAPEEVSPWINVELWSDSKQEVPELFSSILNSDWESGSENEGQKLIPQFLQLSDFPNVQTTWDKYIEDKWRAWTENDRKKEKVQDCYNQLFRLHRATRQIGDKYELILAVGCLHWMLQHNWALIERERSDTCRVYFIVDTSGIFDELEFSDTATAEEALLRNGFTRYAKDGEAQQFLTCPAPPFHRRPHPNGPIYSSGRYWL